MIKKIYIYWSQKFINAPIIVKKCLLSWKLKNPDWKIIELDDDNLNGYINIEKEIPNIKNKKITKTSYSDIVRIFLLEKYGGCWCDATTFCNQPLDKWLNNNISTGFFGYEMKSDRLISSWFLYAEKDNYILKKWKESVIEYIDNVDNLGSSNIHTSLKIWNNDKYSHRHYFWFHYLFGDLYKSDCRFKKIWDLTPKISSNGPHYIQTLGLLNKISDRTKSHINNVKTPIYKLSFKYNNKKYNKNCNLSYLLDKINLKFIHIPKTGGTSIEMAAKRNNLLWGTFDKSLKNHKCVCSPWHCPQKVNTYCFCVIRNPYDRFISQFYHENKIEDYTRENLNKFIKIKIPKIKNNINIDDNHFLPQIKFYEKCDIIISFENLQKNLNKLTKLFNLSNLVLDNLPGGKTQQIKRKSSIINRLTYLDIEENHRIIIKNIYKSDFDLYNEVKKNGILIK